MSRHIFAFALLVLAPSFPLTAERIEKKASDFVRRVSTRDEAEQATESMRPDYILDSAACLSEGSVGPELLGV